MPSLTVGSLPNSVMLHSLAAPIYRHDFIVVRRSLDGDPGIRRLRALLTDAAGRVGGRRGILADSTRQE
jgi:hypothetical protein